MRNSLTLRLLATDLIGIALVLLVLPWVTISLLHRAIDVQQQGVLETQVMQIAAGIRTADGQVRIVLPPTLTAVYAGTFDGRSYLVLDASGQIRLGSSRREEDRIVAASRRAGGGFFRAGGLVGMQKTVSTAAGPLSIIVSQNENDPGAIVDDVARSFLSHYMVVLVAALALLPFVNLLILRQLVGRIRQVSRKAAEIGPETSSERLDESGLPTEIATLVNATNRLVDRLKTSIGHHRTFVANVAHEVKTPLTALKMDIDALADGGSKAALNRSVDRLSHVVSQLRDLSELETLHETVRERFDLAGLARQMAELLAPQVYAESHTLELNVPSAPVLVMASSVLIELALRNLVDNARQHTPPGTAITIDVSGEGVLTVSDDGPGLTQDARQLATRRYWRADHSRSDTAGLGLAIVTRICEVHGTQLEIDNLGGRGAQFVIRLQLAQTGIG